MASASQILHLLLLDRSQSQAHLPGPFPLSRALPTPAFLPLFWLLELYHSSLVCRVSHILRPTPPFPADHPSDFFTWLIPVRTADFGLNASFSERLPGPHRLGVLSPVPVPCILLSWQPSLPNVLTYLSHLLCKDHTTPPTREPFTME